MKSLKRTDLYKLHLRCALINFMFLYGTNSISVTFLKRVWKLVNLWFCFVYVNKNGYKYSSSEHTALYGTRKPANPDT